MNNVLALDHAELHQLLAKLFAAFDAEDLEQSHARLDYFWARLGVHIRAEHLQLFPAIIRAVNQNRDDSQPSAPDAHRTIAKLHHDHDIFMSELSGAMQLLRQLVSGSGSLNIEEGMRQARARVEAASELLVSHNELEENQVYLWADRLLDSSERAALEVKLQHEIENTPPRFSKSSD